MLRERRTANQIARAGQRHMVLRAAQEAAESAGRVQRRAHGFSDFDEEKGKWEK